MERAAHHSGDRTLLFLDKVFLKRVPRPLRGVELFNLRLARDLADLGWTITLPAEPSWSTALQEFLPGRAIDVRLARRILINPSTLVTAGLALRGYRGAHMLLGNVGDGILPLVRRLYRRSGYQHGVLIAHREASDRFVQGLHGFPFHVVAVNGQIAQPFRAAGFRDVAVDYGIFESAAFAPAAAKPADGVTRFIVLGALDNAWKGSDTAVAAFRQLPDDLRARCELHLASFLQPPTFPETNIRAYGWMPADGIPDLLRGMDVMLCPSRDEVVMRETFSQAMVQGMLTGLPILASRLPILTEKLDAGGGAVFGSVHELSELMAKLAAQPELRQQWGHAARETARARYVWDTARFVARYLQPA